MKRRILPGRFYDMRDDGPREVDPPGRTEPIRGTICRRVADFEALPPGAALDDCARCGERIAYNPERSFTPRVCMQCAGFEPERSN